MLKDCTTSVEKGEVIVVCGTSGSGKSTLIKAVNALEPNQKGDITVDGIKVNDPKTDLPKLRARVGMVFQHFELFPHLTVQGNLEFGLKRIPAAQRHVSLDQAIEFIAEDELVEVTPLNVRLRKMELDSTRRQMKARREDS